ncbi:helix-turn-helix domain-containing protein [Vibrio sp. 99-70-13A1]|uniref:MarR family winged helix-turn-helix transcriptional regulator n=1 Tax=Vibrio sp. 99-70-13A1 TaxID=2607601 RepID=UPI00149380B8|nr:helix-turn-helix domain-containing protein [Vibrio sp. 99-70-13A1]NOH98983.1 MarR family transcriptional regulator [Vibrio sp. 99-70-13A1]
MDNTKPLYEIIESSRIFMNKMNTLVDKIHKEKGVNSCSRGVMLILKSEGFKTIPQLARETQRSRQYLQKTISNMESKGLITLTSNPDHKTSSLVELTKRGTQVLTEILNAEAALISTVDIPVDSEQLKSVSSSLKQLTLAFQNK